MLASFEEVAAEIQVDASELTVWIEYGWVLPVAEGGRYFFDESDLARARLIAELHRDLDVNEQATPVVLQLLDQVYGLRQALADLNLAIKELPEETRSRLQAELRRISKPADADDS